LTFFDLEFLTWSRSPGCFTHRSVNASGSYSGDRENVLTMGSYCYVAVCRRGRLGSARRLGTHGGRRGAGAYCGGRPPTACYSFISDTLFVHFYSSAHRHQAILLSDVWLSDVCLSGTSGLTREQRDRGRLKLAQR